MRVNGACIANTSDSTNTDTTVIDSMTSDTTIIDNFDSW